MYVTFLMKVYELSDQEMISNYVYEQMQKTKKNYDDQILIIFGNYKK